MDARERAIRDRYCEAFRDDLDQIISELIQEVLDRLPEYRYLVETLRDTELERNMRRHLHNILHNIEEAAPVEHYGEEHLGFHTALARADQGFPLASILRTYQYTTRAIWRWTSRSHALEDIRREAFELCVPHALDYVDAATSATSEAYVAWAQRRAAEDAVARRRLLNDLLTGSILGIEAERGLVELGVDTWPGFVVAVFRGSNDGSDMISGSAEAILQMLTERALPPGLRPLALRRDRELVVLLPATTPRGVELGPTEYLRQAIDETSRRLHSPAEIFGAVSDPVRQARNLPMEYARTTRAARTAAVQQRVVMTSELHLLDHALTAMHLEFDQLCPPGMREFLTEHGEAHPEWVSTIIAWMESGLNASAAAKQLGVHSNTVYYRLAQVESRSGLDLRDFSTAFDMYVVARLQADFLSSTGPRPEIQPTSATRPTVLPSANR